MMKYLQTIKEEEEHDNEGVVNTMEMLNLSPAPAGSFTSPLKKNWSLKGSEHKKSFVIGEEQAPAPETED